jgi:ferredoxin-NADP reductase
MTGKSDKVNVRGHLWDLLAFRRLVPKRQKRIAKASSEPLTADPVRDLAWQLHPSQQHLLIQKVRDETKTAKTFKLVPDPDSDTRRLAYFRAGQYLSLRVPVNGVSITRPYSLSSAPFEALGEDGFYEITLKKTEDGFLSEHVWKHWQVGTRVDSSGPEGHFYHEPLRDKTTIVGLAGGSGITPFRSMAREIAHGGLDVKLLLLYGSSDQEDIIFYDEFKELEGKAPGQIKVVHVLSCDEVSMEDCEHGFLTADIVQKYVDVDASSFFVCGPQVMYRFVEKELAALNLPKKRIRREAFGTIKDVSQLPGFPLAVADETFRLRVRIGSLSAEIPAQAKETILVALERANLAPPARCRSGECGFCRSLLLDGNVYVSPEDDGRRAADRLYNYIHPCASWPITDLELQVSRSS